MAAKAAGYEINPEGEGNPYYPCNCRVGFEEEYERTPALLLWKVGVWSPLTGDGDALRLAVELKLDTLHMHGAVGITSNDHKFEGYIWESFDEESGIESHLASTRRAIVRAAAEIGKKTP